MIKYLSEIVKIVLSRKPTKSSPTVTWKDILKEEFPGSRKKQRVMLLPSKRVLLWKSEVVVKEKNKKKQAQSGLNIAFKFDYDNIPYFVQTQRPFDQLMLSGALPKISTLMQKKVFGNKQDTSKNDISLQANPNLDYEISEKTTVKSFSDDARVTSLLVNGEEYQIVRNGTPIQSVTLALTPIAEQYCMPTIAFNAKDTAFKLHWFVKNEMHVEKVVKSAPSKRDMDSLDLSFINEEMRIFNLKGYTFRHTGTYFVPTSDDVGRLVAVVMDTGVNHPVNAAISSRPVLESLHEVVTDDQVKWCQQNRLEDCENIVRVMSYNILADLYLNLNKPQEELFFNYCPKANQRVFYRTPIFLKQLQDFADSNVSIIFLQEVDMSRHENFLKPFLQTINYDTEISKKMRQISEGVAIAFDKRKFRSLYSNSFALTELTEMEDINKDVLRILNSSDVSLERFSTRPTIVQIVELEDIKTGTIFMCANTHLHHNPLDEHVKALQALVCTRKLLQLYNEKKRRMPERDIRVLFGGDFNSTPDGPVYQLMANGFLLKEDESWKCDEKISAEDIRIDVKMNCLTGTPEYTNYTADSQKTGFVGCLDYIWGIGVESHRICPMPDHKKVIEHVALPSPNSPSDHLPIICDIKL